MRHIKTTIENGKLINEITDEIKWSEVKRIIKYLDEDNINLKFKNGDSEEHYNNLLDEYNNFTYIDCETLLHLVLLCCSSYNGNSEFYLADGYEEILISLNRLNSIDSIIS